MCARERERDSNDSFRRSSHDLHDRIGLQVKNQRKRKSLSCCLEGKDILPFHPLCSFPLSPSCLVVVTRMMTQLPGRELVIKYKQGHNVRMMCACGLRCCCTFAIQHANIRDQPAFPFVALLSSFLMWGRFRNTHYFKGR